MDYCNFLKIFILKMTLVETIRLCLSVLKLNGYIEFTFNQARHISTSTEGSYYLLKGIKTANIHARD